MKEKQITLTRKDQIANAFQGVVRGIPFIGSSLEQFIFGPLNELRMQRIEATLQEVAEAVEKTGLLDGMVKEEFVNLLETTMGDLCRATDERRRERFRDFLINAASLAPKSLEWGETKLVADLLREIDTPGLVIIATISRISSLQPLTLTRRPESQLYDGEFDFDNPGTAQHPLGFEWIIIEEWAIRLKALRVLTFATHDARGGYGGVRLTSLGKFFVRWVLADDKSWFRARS